MASDFSRRGFLKAAGAISASAYAARAIPALAAVPDKGTIAVTPPLATFPYSAVELLDGPMKQQFDENHARFLNLDDDRLLKVFRQVAGSNLGFIAVNLPHFLATLGTDALGAPAAAGLAILRFFRALAFHPAALLPVVCAILVLFFATLGILSGLMLLRKRSTENA
jgi:hypothetical protein